MIHTDRFRNFAFDFAERHLSGTCSISVTEANNEPVTDAAPMPVKSIIGGMEISDGNPLPVSIENVTVTVGELNVLLSAYGSPYDSVRVSDGTDELQIDASGAVGANLRVLGAAVTALNPIPISGSFSASIGQIDESSFVEGVNNVVPLAGVRIDSPLDDPPDNSVAAPRITNKRALHTNLRNASGAEFGTSGAPIRVDTTGATTQPTDSLQLTLRSDVVDATTYVGEALPGTATASATWRVKRITDASNDITITWADGNSSFDNVWDDRLTLSYS